MDLTIKYSDKVDELFSSESKLSLVTNKDYDWTGAHTVRVYRYTTAPLNDYKRNATSESPTTTMTRYGELYDLNSQVQEMVLKNDRSFIFNIDKLDQEESELESAKALAREIREVVIPEIDNYVYSEMTKNAGHKTKQVLNEQNIYDSIITASEVLDTADIPDTDRKLIVTPTIYKLMKKADIFDNTDIGSDLRLKGVIGMIDGVLVIKVNANRLPENFGFLMVHPSATTAPIKLEDYNIHSDTPLASGDIVTGRVCYDAFVLDNKKTAIYYNENAEE